MRTLLDLFHAEAHTPQWEEKVYQAAERINPSASGLTRAYRNDAFVMVRLKKAERLATHRALPFVEDAAAADWPSAEVRDILPNLQARARKFGADATPPLLAGTISLYDELASPSGLKASLEASPDALAKLERNPAYRFDPAAYSDYLDRVRFEAAAALLSDQVDPETVPAAYFVDPSRRADLEFRAALDSPHDPQLWENLAAADAPGFFRRWAGHRADAAHTELRRQSLAAVQEYGNSLELLEDLRDRSAQGRDWTAVWLDLHESTEAALAAARASGSGDPVTGQRIERLESLHAALESPRPLPLTAVTVRFGQQEMDAGERVRVRLRIEPSGEVFESGEFPLGPAAPAGTGWVGTAAVDWRPEVGAHDSFTAEVILSGSGRPLLEVAWDSLVERAGPSALTRPRESEAGSVRFLLDPAWWKGLDLPAAETMQPVSPGAVVSPPMTHPGR